MTSNGVEAAYAYNLAGLVTNISYKKNNSILSGYTYTYYLDGNQQSKTSHTGETTEYIYDGLDRLVLEKTPDITTQYSYDEQGNRSQMQVTGTESYTAAYQYDENNRLLWEQVSGEGSAPTAATQYYYDANGNRLAKTSMLLSAPTGQPAGVGIGENAALYELYTYNPLNQIIGYERDGITAGYTYDAGGSRIGKTVNGETTTHIWNGSSIVMELDGNGTAINRYLRGGGLIKSERDGYYITDAHGDVVRTAGEDGSANKSYAYDAFGNQETAPEEDFNPFRYAGEYYDWESGLIYLRARYYDSHTGRFLNEDPIRDGMNWYVYASNNPVKFVDPTGLASRGAYLGNDPRNPYTKGKGSGSNSSSNLNSTYTEKNAMAVGNVSGGGQGTSSNNSISSSLRFTNYNDLVKHFAYNNYGITDYAQIEVAALIYEHTDENGTYFSYTNPQLSGSNPHGISLVLNPDDLPENAILRGTIHTHPGGELENAASGVDKSSAEELNLMDIIIGPNKIIQYSYMYPGWRERTMFKSYTFKPLTSSQKAQLKADLSGMWQSHLTNPNISPNDPCLLYPSDYLPKWIIPKY